MARGEEEIMLKGRVVKLRKLRKSDVDKIYEQINDMKIIKNLERVPWPYKRKDAVCYVNKKLKEYKKPRIKRSSFDFAIELNSTKEFIGITSLHTINLSNNNCYTGTWMGVDYWGKGYNKDSKKLLLNYAFKQLKFHKVLFSTYTDNKRSQKSIEKTGAKKEAIFRKDDFKMGKWKDSVVYGLLKKEWKPGKLK